MQSTVRFEVHTTLASHHVLLFGVVCSKSWEKTEGQRKSNGFGEHRKKKRKIEEKGISPTKKCFPSLKEVCYLLRSTFEKALNFYYVTFWSTTHSHSHFLVTDKKVRRDMEYEKNHFVFSLCFSSSSVFVKSFIRIIRMLLLPFLCHTGIHHGQLNFCRTKDDSKLSH